MIEGLGARLGGHGGRSRPGVQVLRDPVGKPETSLGDANRLPDVAGPDPLAARLFPPRRGFMNDLVDLQPRLALQIPQALQRSLSRSFDLFQKSLSQTVTSPHEDKDYPTVPTPKTQGLYLHLLWNRNTQEPKTVLHSCYKRTRNRKLV